MQKKNTVKRIQLKTDKSEPSKRVSSFVAATACGLILTSGFFFAARQHFSSMEYGIKNSRLRKQLDDLRAEKQRLIYTREVAISPNEIKRAAKKASMFDSRTQTAPAPEMASVRRENKPATTQESKPTVIKTGSAARVAPRIERTLQVVARNEKPQK
ncbi:hypothetical protein BH20ACI2_BH20ACI2_04540 [soil metagenome]